MELSIVIPAKVSTKQDLAYLEQALASAIKQTQPCEIIVVENGSTQNTGGLKRRKDFKPVHWIDLPQANLANARNEGVKATTTEWFFCLDIDDTLPENAAELLWKHKPTEGFLYGSTFLFDEDGGFTYQAQPYDFKKVIEKVTWTNGTLQRKSDWEKIGGWDPQLDILEDWDYWLTAGEKGICGNHIPEVVYNYRKNPNGLIAQVKSDKPRWDKAVVAVKTKHISIFKGVFPMGCCGNKTRVQSSPSKMPGITVPQSGFVTLKYVGNNVGTMTWYGAVTGRKYLAGGSRPLVNVDARDLETGITRKPGFLELREKGAPVFVRN